MNKNKFVYAVLSVILVLGPVACKDQLDVGNPNAPTVAANVNTEAGLVSYVQGLTYINGFANGLGWLGDSYFSLPWGYSEILADNVGADASNNQITTIGIPDYIILDDGTKVSNTGSASTSIFRSYNTRAATGAGNNAIYYDWLAMYALNNSMNSILAVVDGIPYSGDAATKVNTVKAWAYWWKGYAYSVIGSKYYAGVIVDKVNSTSSEYVLHDAIIAESNKNFNQAASILQGITNTTDYSAILKSIIPIFNQTGHGGVPTPTMWIHNINTMLARNILVNKLATFVNGTPGATISKSSLPVISAADWASIKTLATNGVQKGDYIFVCYSTATNSIFSASAGSVASNTSAINTSSTFKIGKRFLQYYKAGDARFTNNFKTGTTYKNNYTYTTDYSIIPDGAGAKGVVVYGSKAVGGVEVVMAGSYEENALMLAEANIWTGATDAGLAYVDAVRSYLGAGIAPVSGTGLSQAAALKELVAERRVALIFRGLSYYDNRRWGWSYSIANGGGSYGNTVIMQPSGKTYTNVTISYNFMDYWDVPADETVLNPPSAATAGNVVNPNF